MDYGAWRQHLASGLGHDAAIPWHEPCRLHPPFRHAVANLAAKSTWLLRLAAAWCRRLSRSAADPDEAAALCQLGEAFGGHATSLHRLATTLGDDRSAWLRSELRPLPALSRGELLVLLLAAEVLARVWIEAIIEGVGPDPLVSSVFATLLYERAFLVAYAKHHVQNASRHPLARSQQRLAQAGWVPFLVVGAWLFMGRDLQVLTGWRWADVVPNAHRAYERAFSGPLAHLRPRETLRALAWLPL